MTPYILLPSLLSIIFFLSCTNPFNPKQIGENEGRFPYVAPTTPEAVILNLKTAYNAKDLEGYLKCLNRDSFKFYFDQSDTSIQDILKENWGLDSLVWGYTEEKLSTSALFEGVRSVYLELVKESVDPDTFSNRKTLNYLYLLSLDPSPPGIETIEGRAKFTVKRESDGYWYIIVWRDYAFGD
jgi:hypothetical protein